VATNDDDQLVLAEPSDADDSRGPHGWVRIVLALALGLLAGALIALLLPREDGPRRARRAVADPARTDPSLRDVVTDPAVADPATVDPRMPPTSGTTVDGGPGSAVEG
jgi:hypothetical protein